MEEILVAVDGSRYSNAIIEYSCKLARKLSGKITLIYVSNYPDLLQEYIGVNGNAPSPQAERYVKIAESITSTLGQIITSKGIPCEIVLETGNATERIISAASNRKASLIVLGLRGLHGLERIRSLGSVARRVLENSPCPVLVVTGEEMTS